MTKPTKPNTELVGILEVLLLRRLKVIGDDEWTILGTPDDVIKDLVKLITQEKIKENEYWLGVSGNDVRCIHFEDFEDRIATLKEGLNDK